jgi:hypothetical protein
MPAQKIPQYYDVTIRLTVDEYTYKERIAKGYTPEQIKDEVKHHVYIHKLPAPTWDAEVMGIEESSDNALEHRIDKITKGGAL